MKSIIKAVPSHFGDMSSLELAEAPLVNEAMKPLMDAFICPLSRNISYNVEANKHPSITLA